MAASSIVDSGLCLKKEPIKILHRESIKESQSSLFSFYGPLFFFAYTSRLLVVILRAFAPYSKSESGFPPSHNFNVHNSGNV